ncbi:hypothetical protein Dd586_0719 [Dickeya parazeae Ech586]|uniref:Uncharacterized protein n=1 Tax=Dickeya zeae (strain Ech586) TaxID=590409 RepID=D2BSJ3_DICZ5|nr:hypothetical protein Dd586_0719 [Dickeya parazeae Ech586]
MNRDMNQYRNVAKHNNAVPDVFSVFVLQVIYRATFGDTASTLSPGALLFTLSENMLFPMKSMVLQGIAYPYRGYFPQLIAKLTNSVVKHTRRECNR